MPKNNKMIICKNCNTPILKNTKICQTCGAKIKKPFFKKWWFWLIIIILIFISIGNDDSNDSDKENDMQIITDSSTLEETDLPDDISEDSGNKIESPTGMNTGEGLTEETSATEEQDGITGTISSLTETAEEAYKKILDEYTVKLQEETPRLIEEYKAEAANNTGGLEGLAELATAKVEELAVISNEGVGEMANVMYKKGSGSYEEYESWAGKLMEVYMEESQKIMDYYMDSAM